MEQLLKFTHSQSTQQKCFTKQWELSIDNVVHVLKYEESHLEEKTSSFYLKSICSNIIIYNIDEWVNKNIIHLEKSENNYQKCLKLVEYINEHIGDNTSKSVLEVEWNIPEYLRLSIKFYETVTPNNEPYILLNYKQKDIFLSEYKLKKFIDNNKKTIQKKNNKQKETPLIKPLSPLIKKYDTNMFIKRTLKERYESQACKPLPEKHAWEN